VQSTSHQINSNSSYPAHSTTEGTEDEEVKLIKNIELAGEYGFKRDIGVKADLAESESANNDIPQTLHNIALHRLQILHNQAPLPPLTLNPNLIKNSPPKVILQDLLASSPSASSTSSLSTSPRSLKNHDEEVVVRMPKGPNEPKGGSGAGFSKIVRYNSREQETDEMNLRMPISGLDGDAIDALSPVSEGVRNPDEIFISVSDGEEEVEGEVGDVVGVQEEGK
jgi:hypothetical protein